MKLRLSNAAKAAKAAGSEQASAADVRASQPPTNAVPSKREQFRKAAQPVFDATRESADVVMPALQRSVHTAAQLLEAGEPAADVMREAMNVIWGSPEALAAFKHVSPAIHQAAATIGPRSAAVGKLVPMVANGQTAKAILKLSGNVAGPHGRRLAGAAMRGLSKGGLSHSAAEIAATAARIAAKQTDKPGALGVLAKGLGHAAPAIGHADNLVSLGTSIAGMVQTLRDPNATKGQKLGRALHIACTVALCFVSVAAKVK